MAEARLASVEIFGREDIIALMRGAPQELKRELGRAFFKIGQYDIQTLRRRQLSGRNTNGLNVRRRGLGRSFKFVASDSRKAKDLGDLFLTEYTRWPAAEIHQAGGTIRPKRGRALTILTDEARTAGGAVKREYRRGGLARMIREGQASVIQTRRGPIVVRHRGGLTKSGKPRKGTRDEVVAFLRPSVRLRKRLDFFKNHERNTRRHNVVIDQAADRALQKAVKRRVRNVRGVIRALS